MFSPDFLIECIDDPFKYQFSQIPDKVPGVSAARSYGINCVSLPYLNAKLNGYYLPPGALPYELFRNETNIATVNSLGDMCLGDFIWVGPEGIRPEDFRKNYDENGFLTTWRDGPAQHMMVFAGRRKCGEPVYVHASYRERMTVAQTFREFDTTKKAHQIYRVGRLITPSTAEIMTISGASRMSC